MKNIAFPLTALAFASLATSCRQDGPDSSDIVLQNIVELNQVDKGMTTVHYYPQGVSEPLILTARGEVIDTTQIHIGDSFLLAYTSGEGEEAASVVGKGTSGYIRPLSYSRITNLRLLQTTPEGLAGWDSDPVAVDAGWLAGWRLNMRVNLTYSSEPRKFAIIIDSNTLSDPVPTAYLYNQRDTDADNFSRRYYVACNLTPLFSRENITGLKLVILNSDGSTSSPVTYTLLK